MARSDFNWVQISHKFTESDPSKTVEFPIEGNLNPVDDAFLLIQIVGVGSYDHKIFINNKPLPGSDLPIAPGKSGAQQLWMDQIPPGYLMKGTNTIRIDRAAADDFTVHGAAIHWRE